MGLITNEVEVTCVPFNKKWYESKNYIWQHNTKLLIKVEDLPNKSSIKVDVKCDNCGKDIKNVTWVNYKKYVKEDKKYYCNSCANKLFTFKKTYKTKLQNSKSFEQWCIENNRLDILNRFDIELNNCKSSEISYSSSCKKYYFKCPKGIHKSELKHINSFVSGYEGSMNCKACNSFAQWGIDNLGEDFLYKYWDYDKNIVNPWEISHGSNIKNNSIYIKCQKKNYHGSYNTTCSQFCSGNSCPYCSNRNGKVHPLDSLGTLYSEVLELWSDKNGDKTPYEYSPNSKNKVYWKCSDGKHEDYYRDIKSSNNFGFRCPSCSIERKESFLQEKVRLYIESFGYTILHENNCTIIPKNPKTKQNLPFDNEIIINDKHFIIEVNGKQHYQIQDFHIKSAKYNNSTPEYELHMQKVRDRYKRLYVYKQKYNFLEIPYWTDDKEETWKKLINEKLKEIKKGDLNVST